MVFPLLTQIEKRLLAKQKKNIDGSPISKTEDSLCSWNFTSQLTLLIFFKDCKYCPNRAIQDESQIFIGDNEFASLTRSSAYSHTHT